MRVLLVADALGVLGAPAVTGAVARGWQTHAPTDVVTAVHMSDGARDLAAALAPGGWHAVAPGVALLGAEPATVVVDSARVLRGADSTAPLAAPLLAARATDASRVVVGAGREPFLDGGAGLADRLTARFHDLRAARAALRGPELLVAGADPLPLLGMHGAAASLSGVLGPAGAQEVGTEVGRFAAEVERALAPMDLASGRPVRWSALPRSGLAGGAAFLLMALGAAPVDARELVAEAVGLADAVAAADLCVVVLEQLTPSTLVNSALPVVARRALAAARPLVVLAGVDTTSRSERAAGGISASYPFEPALGEEGLVVRAERLARTWSPRSRGGSGIGTAACRKRTLS